MNTIFYPYGIDKCPPRKQAAKPVPAKVKQSYRQRLALIVHSATKSGAAKVWPV